MAPPNLPDNESPPPSSVPLKATPGQFDWVRMHPSISSQNVSDGSSPRGYASPKESVSRRSSNSPLRNPNPMTPPSMAPRNLHPANMQTPNSTANSQRKSRQAAHNASHNERQSKAFVPRTLHPATKQTPKYASTFPNTSSRPIYNAPLNPYHPSTPARNDGSSYQSNGTDLAYNAPHNPPYNTPHNQSQFYTFAPAEATSPYQPTAQTQSRTLVNDSGWPYRADLLDQGHLESRLPEASADLLSATSQAQNYASYARAVSRERDDSFPLDPRLLEPLPPGVPLSLLSANLPLQDFSSLDQYISRDPSDSPSPNPESPSQSRAEFEASTARQRSESRSSSEDDDDE
jgi:hypothetical protein